MKPKMITEDDEKEDINDIELRYKKWLAMFRIKEHERKMRSRKYRWDNPDNDYGE